MLVKLYKRESTRRQSQLRSTGQRLKHIRENEPSLSVRAACRLRDCCGFARVAAGADSRGNDGVKRSEQTYVIIHV